MNYQIHNKPKRARRSTSGSYHSAREESDYENDIDELENEEEEIVVPKKTFREDPQIDRHIRQRPFFTIAFLLGVIAALIAVLVIDNIKKVHRNALS